MTFKTGLTIQAIMGLTPSNLVKIGSAVKLQHIEFDLSVFTDILNVVEQLQTEQTAIHAPYMEDYKIDLSSRNPAVDSFIDDVNQWKTDLNVIGVVVHPPLDAGGDLGLFYDRLEKIPLPLLENMPYQSWADFLEFFDTTKSNVNNEFGMCFDIPHSFITNGDEFLNLPKEVLEHIKSKKGYIHISGGNRDEDIHYPLLTEGDMPFSEVKNFLKEIAFRGTVTMELRPSTLNDVEKILQSYVMMLSVANRRKHQLMVRIKTPFIMRKISKLSK
ncbi:MAG: sugar phosphate isomerase/epimerase [Candidatus Heimdallarchaeota archaeon]|nr:sugar phosphate isomerase/epimerase [Candidatus Heimdallarchaeota archaeon]